MYGEKHVFARIQHIIFCLKSKSRVTGKKEEKKRCAGYGMGEMSGKIKSKGKEIKKREKFDRFT